MTCRHLLSQYIVLGQNFSVLAADEFQHVSCCWTANVSVLNAFMQGKILHGDKGNGYKVLKMDTQFREQKFGSYSEQKWWLKSISCTPVFDCLVDIKYSSEAFWKRRRQADQIYPTPNHICCLQTGPQIQRTGG